jgi:Flp pilus assembly protein TadG
VKPIRSGQAPRLGDEHGSTIVFVSLAMAALLSMVALAVDVGMLYTARGEAQRAADAAALGAAAAAFLDAPGDEQRARNEAVRIGGENTVQGEPVVVDPEEDVDVDLANQRVTVTVRRIGSRGNAVVTWFASVFGIGQADVAAIATAEAGLANAAVCVKPFAVPDGFADVGWDGSYQAGNGDYYDAPNTGYGSDYRNGLRNKIDGKLIYWNNFDPAGTTYAKDFGRPLGIKPGDASKTIVASWYFPWDIPQANGAPITGADRYRWNIANCNPNPIVKGQPYQVETGNMTGPTRQGVLDLIAMDPNTSWDLAGDSAAGSRYRPWKASPRVITIPLFDPSAPVEPGKKPVVFNNLTDFYLEGIYNGEVWGRFLYASGIVFGGTVLGPGGNGTGNQAKVVHLVQ